MKANAIRLFLLFTGLCIILFVLTFRPIINPQMDSCSLVKGRLTMVKSDFGSKDISLRLEGSDKYFYINRGLEQGLTEDSLKTLIGKNISVYAVNHWTLLDPKSNVKHVSQIECDGKILFTEFD